ncbi:hypothetical protein GGH12_002094 [Coemansia sp. RSA 1822]|nr:hypothetical protein LPJ76_002554 [Coemansia sp. RSA 638]KAJ2122737.1 hypothetical protein IW147_003147 [Coemansia sp. RSA 720]KAJ2478597.1 hypothetical protein IWW56_003623 [Coemansia sp. RSA 2131]KAJ2543316.1 hypothetical protein GGF49_002202 [Coemansia sp. RSA 1853]KAJ2564214.1 hypothetical protein GGH12_002094 [Coemansia sp. RSA 1822]KAJ2655542.1 hypothetical protein IW148_006006 [Coemansia sp. RSA 1199]
MNPLLDKLDETVEAALQTLFPPTDTTLAKDAQQRAHDFATQVSTVHAQFAELKSTLDEHPRTCTPRAILEKEITVLRQDIQLKNDSLEKYRKLLADYSEKLKTLDNENRINIEGI